jgi:hypothetical protein
MDYDGVRCLHPDEKHGVIRAYAERYNLHHFVETGTNEGEACRQALKWARTIVSCDLSAEHVERSRSRLAQHANVSIALADSGTWLPWIVNELKEPALFWLDAHGSCAHPDGRLEYTLRKEVVAAASAPRGSVILVDDQRMFGVIVAMSMDELRGMYSAPGWDVTGIDDIVRIVPVP